jgi:hypothetical protein
MKLNPRTRWSALALVILAACCGGESGAWGVTQSSCSWATDLTADPAARVPGLAEGTISNTTLMIGAARGIQIALWSNGDIRGESSGGGPATGSSMQGAVHFDSAQPVRFSFSSTQGSQARGTIGDQGFTLDAGGLYLIYADTEGVRVEEIDLPAEALEALEAFDCSERSQRDAFAANWGVDEFFKAAAGR